VARLPDDFPPLIGVARTVGCLPGEYELKATTFVQGAFPNVLIRFIAVVVEPFFPTGQRCELVEDRPAPKQAATPPAASS
jgi:hypothetical protein